MNIDKGIQRLSFVMVGVVAVMLGLTILFVRGTTPESVDDGLVVAGVGLIGTTISMMRGWLRGYAFYVFFMHMVLLFGVVMMTMFVTLGQFHLTPGEALSLGMVPAFVSALLGVLLNAGLRITAFLVNGFRTPQGKIK